MNFVATLIAMTIFPMRHFCVVFLTDFAAAEVMLNVGGYNFKWGYQSIKDLDAIDKGSLNRSGANFKMDLFSIKFGLTFYL